MQEAETTSNGVATHTVPVETVSPATVPHTHTHTHTLRTTRQEQSKKSGGKKTPQEQQGCPRRLVKTTVMEACSVLGEAKEPLPSHTNTTKIARGGARELPMPQPSIIVCWVQPPRHTHTRKQVGWGRGMCVTILLRCCAVLLCRHTRRVCTLLAEIAWVFVCLCVDVQSKRHCLKTSGVVLLWPYSLGTGGRGPHCTSHA